MHVTGRATLLMHLGITHISLIANDHFEHVDMFITSLLTDNLWKKSRQNGN